jgi:ribose transport system permease protein
VAIEAGSGDPNIGTPYTLNSITAAVLEGISFFGGVGEMKGAVIGALVLGFLLNILTFSGISSFYQYILQGVVLIAAISLKALAMSRKD